ncbi:MAG: type IV pilus assembly protein PilM [Planctomycetes bacterium]|nr:type IV pilus assembly protein PilM [Planctomycetota bacterium]
MAISKACWGIDVGQCALKAVKLRQSGGQVEAVSFDVIEHAKILSQPDADEQQLIRNALDKFLSRNDVKNDLIVVGVPGQASFSRFIKLPPVELRKVPEIVQYEARQQIPFNLEDVIWDYQTMTMPGGGTSEIEVGIFAMKRDIVQDYVNDFTQVKIVPDVVQMAPVALYNYLQYDRKEGSGATLLIDVGAENTSLVIGDGYRVWIRNFPLGGNNFTQALVKSFKLTFAKAENLKRHAAESKYAKEVFQAMRPVFSDMLTEVQRSIGFYTSLHRDSRIDRVLAMGSSFRLPGLQKYLSQNLGIDVAKVEQFNALTGDQVIGAPVFKENVLSFGVAYGLALQGLNLGIINTSLLPPEILKEKELKRKRPFVFAAAASVVVGFALLAAGSYKTLGATDPSDGWVIGHPESAKANVLDDVAKFVESNSKLQSESQTAVANLTTKQAELAQYLDVEKYRDLWYNVLRDIWKATTEGPEYKIYADYNPASPEVPWDQLQVVELTKVWTQFDYAVEAADPNNPLAAADAAKTPIMIVHLQGTAPRQPGELSASVVEQRIKNRLTSLEIANGGKLQGYKPVSIIEEYRNAPNYPYEKDDPQEKPAELTTSSSSTSSRSSSGSGKGEEVLPPKRPWRGRDVWFHVRYYVNLKDPGKEVGYQEPTTGTTPGMNGMPMDPAAYGQ